VNGKNRPFAAYLLLFLIFFQGLSGLFGGAGLVLDPSGRSLQIPIVWLENSPFENYMIPGIILLIVLGVFPLVVLFALLKKINWAWTGTLLLAIALLIWLGVEILIIGYQADPPLQAIYGVVGALMLLLVLLPPVRRYYTGTN
jgi:hypothetical protein